MHRLLIVALTAGLLSSTPAKALWGFKGKGAEVKCDQKEYASDDLFEVAKNGVVVISSPKGRGSGFVVKHQKGKTLLITNSHVLDGSKRVLAEWPNGEQETAYVVRDGKDFLEKDDLAVLLVEGTKGTVLNFKEKPLTVGKEVITIGAPSGLDFTITKGIISGIRDKGRIIQTDAAINPGNSGGPLIDKKGCIVGVNTFKLRDSEGLNFALSADLVKSFLDSFSLEKYLKGTKYQTKKKELESNKHNKNNTTSYYQKELNKKMRQINVGTYLGLNWYSSKNHAYVKKPIVETIDLLTFLLSRPDLSENDKYNYYIYRGQAKALLIGIKKLEKYGNGLDDFNKALEIYPKKPIGHVGKYFICLIENYPNDCTLWRMKVQRSEAKTANDYFWKSYGYVLTKYPTSLPSPASKEGNLKLGLENINKAIQINPDIAAFYFRKKDFAPILARKQIRIAFNKAIRMEPNNLYFLYAKSEELWGCSWPKLTRCKQEWDKYWIFERDVDAALSIINKIIELDPKNPKWRGAKAYLYKEHLGDTENACNSEYEKAELTQDGRNLKYYCND